jgi:hypothetical protein
MMNDEIVEEVHAARAKTAEACDYDFRKMAERFTRLQETGDQQMVTEAPLSTVPSAEDERPPA